jgi:hypothetical protein
MRHKEKCNWDEIIKKSSFCVCTFEVQEQSFIIINNYNFMSINEIERER